MRILLVFLFLFSSYLYAEEIRQGTVTGSKLRMRAKPGTRYEVIGQLSKGDHVKVVKEENGWLKIVAPEEVTGWISNKYIDHGVITGDRINIRAGANVAYSIIGKLNKGDKVEVIEIKSKIWAKIKAPSSAHAWVSAAYVKLEPLIVARDDEENDKLNDVKAVEDTDQKEEQSSENVESLSEELQKEKMASEEVRKQLAELLITKEQNEKELARLEEERKAAIDAKLADEKKQIVIAKLLEEEIKKRSPKLIITINEDNSLLLGQQEITEENLLTAFKSSGPETIAFVIIDEKADAQVTGKTVTALKDVNSKVFLENPEALMKSSFIQLPESMKKDTKLLQSSFITIEVKKDQSLIVGKVTTPTDYLEAILMSYRENFGHSSVFIKSEKGSDNNQLDQLMKTVQKCKFKLINYPSLMSQLKDKEEELQKESLTQDNELINEVTIGRQDQQESLPPGRVRMTGYILQVRESDKHLVDFALAARVNDQFYAVAYLKGRQKELQSFYLKEVEIIGVSKRLDGWTRPILYVEEFKPLK